MFRQDRRMADRDTAKRENLAVHGRERNYGSEMDRGAAARH